jgi:hypothetical protein
LYSMCNATKSSLPSGHLSENWPEGAKNEPLLCQSYATGGLPYLGRCDGSTFNFGHRN